MIMASVGIGDSGAVSCGFTVIFIVHCKRDSCLGLYYLSRHFSFR